MAFMYKDFISSNIMKEDDKFYGIVENSNDYISFSGMDMEDCEKQFKICIDNYLEECEKIGRKPYMIIK